MQKLGGEHCAHPNNSELTVFKKESCQTLPKHHVLVKSLGGKAYGVRWVADDEHHIGEDCFGREEH